MEKQLYLSFKNVEEFLRALREVTASGEPINVNKLQGFSSVVDDFKRIHSFEINDVVQFDKTLPPIMHLVNKQGDIKIGDKLFNISDPKDALNIFEQSDFLSNVDRYRENGYWFNETKDAWKEFFSNFACNDLMQWPGYKAFSFDDSTLSQKTGYDVVIQIWVGNCQKFLGCNFYPGGIGAEVGVYYRRKDLFKDYLYDLLWQWEWWPYRSGYDFNIKFTLSFPNRKEVFFSTKLEKTWWLNKWMEADSYESFIKNYGGTLPSPDDYILTYEINGVAYEAFIIDR